LYFLFEWFGCEAMVLGTLKPLWDRLFRGWACGKSCGLVFSKNQKKMSNLLLPKKEHFW